MIGLLIFDDLFNCKAKMRKNVPLFGFLFGALMPWVGILLFYVFKMRHLELSDYLRGLFYDGDLAAKVFSLALLLSLIPFLIFHNRRWNQASKGVLIATCLYALLIIWLRFVK